MSVDKSSLNDVSDGLSHVKYLVEAVFMAASSLGDRHHIHAIQTVCNYADEKLIELLAMVEKMGESES